MGIQSFFNLLKRHCPEVIRDIPFSDLTGLRIAVDISIFLYVHVRTAGVKGWKDMFINLFYVLKKHHMRAICIFDGPNPPIEKKAEQQKRRNDSKKIIARLERCREIVTELTELMRIGEEITPGFKTEIREITRRKPHEDATNYFNIPDVIDNVKVIIAKLKKQTAPITKEIKDDAKKIVKLMGMACFEADGEAETLCAELAIKGHVDAVLTEDTDVLVYGTPVFLAFKRKKLWEGTLTIVEYHHILEALELNEDEFRDLCILMGCDYNNKGKGIKRFTKTGKPTGLGWVTAFELIKKHRRLEDVENYIVDATEMNYRRCRDLFTIKDTYDTGTLVPYDKKPNFKKLERFMEKHQCKFDIDLLKKVWEPTKIVFEEN